MRTLFITFVFVLMMNLIQSQNQRQITDLHMSDNISNNFSIDNTLKLFKWIDLTMSPQLGGLFAKMFNTVAPNLKWQDMYNDFDFGFNAKVGWRPNKKIKIRAFYNIGMLKFNNNFGEANAYQMKVSVVYKF
ncbi:hypothetical protein L3X39_10065 [Sabulilitoribacter multivorans]|uniref:Uncharacterized protein n=1 Tax=Flaviramulus multivorans TaxID=1304750 RepID=A0ABS9IK53_9FLAO|nr:hypothetical protein [Flaviramulus multivorans]MCF7560980.1 hypothetical protein [Flaviramulus multivorans]